MTGPGVAECRGTADLEGYQGHLGQDLGLMGWGHAFPHLLCSASSKAHSFRGTKVCKSCQVPEQEKYCSDSQRRWWFLHLAPYLSGQGSPLAP